MDGLDRKLARIADRQLALVSLDDVRRAGGDRAQLARRSSAGRIERVAPRVYEISGSGPNPDRLLLANLLSIDQPAAVSHLAAARRFGIPGYQTATPEITVPRGTRIVRPGVRVHESTDLDRCRILEVDGVPTTDPGRTLLDLARYIGPQRLLRNIEWCRRNGLVDWTKLIEVLAAHARRGRPGIRKLRQAIAANGHRIKVTDADLELLIISLLLEHGLPEPELHHEVWDGVRFVAEVDLAYPHLKIAMECDGDVHLQREVRERDLARQNDLVLVGWHVLRFTPERYWNHPMSIVSEVRAARQNRQAG